MSDRNSSAMRAMRREFARLILDNPEAFAACVAEYAEKGAGYFIPPDGKVPRANGVTEQSRALLLAHYQASGATQDKFEEKTIESGNRWNGKRWHDEAIRKNLQRARDRAKENPEFAADVEFFAWAIRELGGID